MPSGEIRAGARSRRSCGSGSRGRCCGSRTLCSRGAKVPDSRGGIGLDVYEHGHDVNPRLRDLPNVLLLPHMGSATFEGRLEMGEKVIINIKTFADGHRPPDRVLPSML